MLTFVEFSKPVDDSFQATSISFGMDSARMAGGASLTAQRNSVQLTKDRDSLSSALMLHCAVGTVFDTVWVELYQDADSDVYLTYTLSGVVIGSLQSGGNSESLGLNCQTMKGDYAGR
jgi:type VI protein secretion system component Hcp